MPEPSLWAVYLQLLKVADDDPTEMQRHQYVFLPAFTGGRVDVSTFSYFTRHQEKLTQKTVWRYNRAGSQGIDGVKATLQFLESEAWEASPVITCQVAPFELEQILADQKTPYRVLSRIRRVSDVTHRYTI